MLLDYLVGVARTFAAMAPTKHLGSIEANRGIGGRYRHLTVSNLSAIIRPVQQSLPLSGPKFQVAGLTMSLDLGNMPLDSIGK